MKKQTHELTDRQKIPVFDDLRDFYNHIHASPPLSKDFDVREINPEVIGSYDFVARPFRHSFYCVALYLEGDVMLNSGFWKTKLQRPALYFKTPYQLLSWNKPERWLKEYFVVFTECFALQHKQLADIIFDLPFFKIEKTIPFEVSEEEAAILGDMYKKIHYEYRSDHLDRYELIAAYTLILLVNIQRLYHQYADTDPVLSREVKLNDNGLFKKFQALLKAHFSGNEINDKAHSVKYYAALLSTHPNHLNAVVKRKTGQTALSLIHGQIMTEAKSLLSQTGFSVKETAFRLGFKEPAHFNNFFRKRMNCTPADFRRAMAL
ncbi:helix-turn-helix domain-containing protein [Chitinophagaceae bacterium MMS25-I14]